MLLKNFFFDLYILLFNPLLYLFMALTFVFSCLLIASLRRKFIFFLIFILLIAIWGFCFNLDGMMLVLMTAEFTILILFLMTYMQLYSNFSFKQNNPSNVPLIFSIIVFFLYSKYATVSWNYVSYYATTAHIVSSDFFILYYFLFDKLPILVIFITLIIGLFSLFFILAYFNLKLVKQSSSLKCRSLLVLRKQILQKQTSFNSKLYIFQN